MTPSYLPPKNWPLIGQPSWLTNQRPVFLVGKSLTSDSHLKSKPTMPLVADAAGYCKIELHGTELHQNKKPLRTKICENLACYS